MRFEDHKARMKTIGINSFVFLRRNFLALAIAGILTPHAQAQTTITTSITSPTLTAGVVTVAEMGLTTTTGNNVVLSQPNVVTNLLTLSNDTPDLMSNGVVPAGTYTNLFFTLTGGYIQLQDGSIYATSPTYVGLPSGAIVTGTLKLPKSLKVNVPGGTVTVSTNSKVLSLPFDISQAAGHLAGSSGTWIFGQVLAATDLVFSGNILINVSLASGVSLPIIDGTQVTLADFTADLSNALGAIKVIVLHATDDPTIFSVAYIYLIPGAYQVTLSAPAGMSFSTLPAVPIDITVVSGQQTESDLVINSATSP